MWKIFSWYYKKFYFVFCANIWYMALKEPTLLVDRYQCPKEIDKSRIRPICFSEFTTTVEKFLKNMEKRSHLIPLLNWINALPVPILEILTEPEVSHILYLLELTSHCNSWECVPFRTVPETSVAKFTPLRRGSLMSMCPFGCFDHLVTALSTFEGYQVDRYIGNMTKLNGSEIMKDMADKHMELSDNATELVAADFDIFVVINKNGCTSTAVITQPEIKIDVSYHNKEMISRKQRQINKLSKKKKRRARKKNKILSLDQICNNKNEPHKLNERKSKCKQPSSSLTNRNKATFCDWEDSDDDLCIVFQEENDSLTSRNENIFCDWEDSDDDLCIVFQEGNDCVDSVLPKSVNSTCEKIRDLVFEFDSVAIVSNHSNTTIAGNSSEIVLQYDSDEEWEADSAEVFLNTDDPEFCSSLFVLNNDMLSSSVENAVHNPGFVSACIYESSLVNDEETAKICEVNKRWKDLTSDISEEPHVHQQVNFACEEHLVTVFLADSMDRKSEWEQYALGRFRFKRRIDEFEKLIAPCFTPHHRDKVYRRLTCDAS